MAVPEPITRLEKYWAAILDKIQGGGSAPVLEQLEVTENGTYTPDEDVDGFDEVVVDVPAPVLEMLDVSANGTYTPDPGMDGFDEVVVQVAPPDPEWQTVTFTGTLAAPFTLADILRLDNADTIYGEMAIDATAIGAGRASAYFNYVNRIYGTLYFSVAGIQSTSVNSVTAAAVAIAIDDDPPAVRLESARMMQQGAIVDVSQYASLMPTTTTFVYHIPSSND